MKTIAESIADGDDMRGKGVVSNITGTYMGEVDRVDDYRIYFKDDVMLTGFFSIYSVVEPRKPGKTEKLHL